MLLLREFHEDPAGGLSITGVSTYERITTIRDASIPDGYDVKMHEIRGYDSPDRWFVCEGPAGWKVEKGDRRRAVEECVSHAKRTAPLEFQESSSLFPCYLCRGARHPRGLSCPVCQGAGELSPEQMAQTHDGRVRLAEIAGPMLRDGAEPRWLAELTPQVREGVKALAKNPCKVCGTWLLEESWVGSAYCSRRCCVDDYKHDPVYAGQMLSSVGSGVPE